MLYDVQIREVLSNTFAAVCGQANAHTIGDRINTPLAILARFAMHSNTCAPTLNFSASVADTIVITLVAS